MHEDIDILVSNFLDLELPRSPLKLPINQRHGIPLSSSFSGTESLQEALNETYPQPLNHAIAVYPEGTVFGIAVIFPFSVLRKRPGIIINKLIHEDYIDPDFTDALVTFLNIPFDYFSAIILDIQKDLLTDSMILSITSNTFIPYLPPRYPGQFLARRIILNTELNQIFSLLEENQNS